MGYIWLRLIAFLINLLLLHELLSILAGLGETVFLLHNLYILPHTLFVDNRIRGYLQ